MTLLALTTMLLWQDAVFMKGRYTCADNGDWEEQRAKILPNGKVKHRVVAHYYAPPLGTAADCVPGNNVMITTPGSPKRIRGLVESREHDACGVLIAKRGGTHTSYAFSRLVRQGYDKKRMEEGTGGPTSDPCADASSAPSYCH